MAPSSPGSNDLVNIRCLSTNVEQTHRGTCGVCGGTQPGQLSTSGLRRIQGGTYYRHLGGGELSVAWVRQTHTEEGGELMFQAPLPSLGPQVCSPLQLILKSEGTGECPHSGGQPLKTSEDISSIVTKKGKSSADETGDDVSLSLRIFILNVLKEHC